MRKQAEGVPNEPTRDGGTISDDIASAGTQAAAIRVAAAAAGCGVRCGIVAESLPRWRFPSGEAVGTGDHVVLRAARLYEPGWRSRAKALADDLSADLVYGLTTTAAGLPLPSIALPDGLLQRVPVR